MTLSKLKEKSSMSELALIEKVESLMRESIKDELKEAISKPIMEYSKTFIDYNRDTFAAKELIQKIVKIVDES